MPPSLGWIVQPAVFENPSEFDPSGWKLAKWILDADERHIPIVVAAGFDTIWVEDHMGWGDKSHLECMTTLAWLAGRHEGARWGTMVSGQAFRNPAYLAKLAVNLHLLTDGRFILGIGAGNNAGEHVEFGLPFGPPGERLDQMEEAIRIIRKLWMGGRQSFRGRHHRIDNAVVAPRPEPAIPLMVGGGGERRTLRLAADLADWWCADIGTVEAFARKSAILDDHCRVVGRDPATIVRSQVAWISISDEPARLIHMPGLHVVAGSPAEVLTELLAFRRAGMDHVQIRFLDFPSSAGMERFVAQVLPALRDAWD